MKNANKIIKILANDGINFTVHYVYGKVGFIKFERYINEIKHIFTIAQKDKKYTLHEISDHKKNEIYFLKNYEELENKLIICLNI